MKNQLQYTTIFVVVLLVALAGALYVVSSPASNQLTSATVAIETVDCSLPLAEDASLEERETYNKLCDSE